jgi:hypothetical protein
MLAPRQVGKPAFVSAVGAPGLLGIVRELGHIGDAGMSPSGAEWRTELLT